MPPAGGKKDLFTTKYSLLSATEVTEDTEKS